MLADAPRLTIRAARRELTGLLTPASDPDESTLRRRTESMSFAVAAMLAAAVPSAAAEVDVAFFESRIRPVLVERCYECHSAEAGQAEGGLTLDSRDGLLAGGDGGPAVVPGEPARSRLLRALRYADDALQMPPDGKLPDAVVADFERWVASGAPDPREAAAPKVAAASWEDTFAERMRHWSFRPVVRPEPPAVADAEWAGDPIDRFVRAELDERGLVPAGPADKATLLRRVTYALTGLPPSADEIEAYFEDGSPDAYERVVDRLLASPRFGERFATHWLDLVRYAETHGSEGDPPIPAAWRYRDYVVRAFDADLPYDRFVREQIAGDLLPDPRIDPATEICESAIGPAHFRLVEHGFQPVDSLDEQVKTVDNQIDVLTKAFQGLTVACARCHDHKFDPVSQEDYYALYGILASSRPAQVTIDDRPALDGRADELAASKTRVKAALADAWLGAADGVAEKLVSTVRSSASDPAGSDSDPAAVAARLDDLDRRARAEFLAGRPVSPGVAPPRPIAAWRFDGDARDVVGDLHLELIGAASVEDGRLKLAGDGAFARSAVLDRPISEKTLEAWVTLGTLDQRGGGVLTLEAKGGEVFDSIVFGERTPGRWAVGSDFFRRSRELDEPDEPAAGVPIHVAAVYTADGGIRVYRNGEPYGAAYTPPDAGLVTYPAGDARVLIGMRHQQVGPLSGEADEARLYDRALSPEEVRASFRVGPGLAAETDLAAALPRDLRDERDRLRRTLAALRRAEIEAAASPDPWSVAFAEAERDEESPLRPWVRLRRRAGDDLAAGWRESASYWGRAVAERAAFNREHFTPLWDLTNPGDLATWIDTGPVRGVTPSPAGAFAIEPNGDRVVAGVYPAGVYSHLLSQKYGGLLASPGFKLPKSVSVRLLGGRGGGVRAVIDNYPIGANGTYPQARPAEGPMTWVRLDTSYRAGSEAYLEFATFDDLTRTGKPPGPASPPDDGRSFFGVAQIVSSDGDATPRDEAVAVLSLLAEAAPTTPEELAGRYAAGLKRVIAAWRDGSLTDAEAAFLDFFVRRGLLPNSTVDLPQVAPLVADYRRVEGGVPIARRAPGLLDAPGRDAPLLIRGNHRDPGEVVPRGYLKALGGEPVHSAASGRLELAAELADPGNPLTARVMANRLWHWLFGRGLVPTPDNFGLLGEPPTHPELLDLLASDLVDDGWSVKRAVRRIVTSRAYRMSSVGSADSLSKDPANVRLSRFRVRRLEAEAIRDGLLAAAGQLDNERFGPGVEDDESAPSARRSLYLAVRRTDPHPFLEVFDKPPPAGTRGQRDVTTLPAQSLTMLNSAFVTELSRRWGARLAAKAGSAPADRVRRVFVAAMGRPPTPDEVAHSLAYLKDGGAAPAGPTADLIAWQDFVQAVLCMKETIYVR